MYIGSNISPRNSHFHFVSRHSIAGISLMWRLAVNNRWINQFVIARWRTIFFKYNLENNELFYSVKCETKSKRNETKRNEIYRNETKSKRNEINRNEIDRNETKRNNSKWNKTYFNETISWVNTRQKLNENRFISFRFVSFRFRFAFYRYPIIEWLHYISKHGGCVRYATSACWENVTTKTIVGTRFEVGSGYTIQTKFFVWP
jgi:hypothetical protein